MTLRSRIRARLVAGTVSLAAAAGVLAVVAGGGTPAAAAADHAAAIPAGNWLEFDYDAQRSGVGPADTGITARNVGRLRTRVVQIDGTVDSSAIEMHAVRIAGRLRDVIVVTTAYGKTLAIDPGTGRRLWEFTPPDIAGYDGSAQITTATPIFDPDGRYVYAASPDGLIRKLVLASGRQVRSGKWPVRVTFDPTHEKIPAALNISGPNVIVTTGGYDGDGPPYQGHVVAIDRVSGHIVGVWNSLCSNRHHLIDPPASCPSSDSAIWGRSGAVIEPGSERILVATGNGPFDGSSDWGDSVLELSADATRLLHNYTPTDQQQLNVNDTDLGSTAPALLPGTGLAVQGGKDGILRLLDLARLDGTRGGAGARLGGERQDIGSPGGDQVFTAPAAWDDRGRDYLFVADNSGTEAYVLGSRHRLQSVWENGTSGTSPVLAGGLLYVYDQRGGHLDVYEPLSGRLLASLGAAGGHWNSPIVVGGRVILPVGDYHDHANSGQIYIFHLRGR